MNALRYKLNKMHNAYTVHNVWHDIRIYCNTLLPSLTVQNLQVI